MSESNSRGYNPFSLNVWITHCIPSSNNLMEWNSSHFFLQSFTSIMIEENDGRNGWMECNGACISLNSFLPFHFVSGKNGSIAALSLNQLIIMSCWGDIANAITHCAHGMIDSTTHFVPLNHCFINNSFFACGVNH